MLFSVNVGTKTATAVPHVTLAQLQLRERYDLQEWILQNPSILGEELLVITSEYAGFDKTAERLDVLALDRQGALTVVELKRSAVGTAAASVPGLRRRRWWWLHHRPAVPVD